MRTSFGLKLCFGLSSIPTITIQLTDVSVKSFGEHWTGANGPVTSVTAGILTVAFVQYASKYVVELFKAAKVDIRNENIHETPKVAESCWPSMNKMIWSYTVQVTHTGFQMKEYLTGLRRRYFRNFKAFTCNFENVFIFVVNAFSTFMT